MTGLTCFKAYDIRGQLGIDLDEDIAYRIVGSKISIGDALTNPQKLARCGSKL